MEKEQASANNESPRWKAAGFPDRTFERLAYAAGAVALALPWILQVLLRRPQAFGPDAAVFFFIPTIVGTFLAMLAILAGIASGRTVQGFARGLALFAFFPGIAFGLAVLFSLDLKTGGASVLSALPGALMAPAGYDWIVRDYVRNKQ